MLTKIRNASLDLGRRDLSPAQKSEIEKLEATSMPVGLVPGAPFVLSYRDLNPGDRIHLGAWTKITITRG